MSAPASVVSRPSTAAIVGAFVLDVVLVVAFAAAGRASHDEDVLAGLAHTSWPFLAALAVGWLVLRAWRAPAAPVRTGVGLWIVTVAGGMLLRVVSDQGTALPFVIVATLTLGALLVGWRLLAALVTRRRR
ncbi:DUF3054 domain-containing protein [Microbacterium sp. No. 7]|uniref:DUF3054 domain-containing protein n=1 Tax=Microbacterium sp. No. 7 TaxID=1714373 RepID=UPI0006CFAF64|nr:DUF3054 domain-containing protein [Microbacterium sp. No. 7]ALJ19425.1 hypothetical protein AOA12_05690 [Microbacterium sp. No. 7]